MIHYDKQTCNACNGGGIEVDGMECRWCEGYGYIVVQEERDDD